MGGRGMWRGRGERGLCGSGRVLVRRTPRACYVSAGDLAWEGDRKNVKRQGQLTVATETMSSSNLAQYLAILAISAHNHAAPTDQPTERTDNSIYQLKVR
jgi:hypothetical protein